MKTYTFYVDRKITTWERETHEVEAETHREAADKMIESFNANLCDSTDTFLEQEILYDHNEYIAPENNVGPTAELYDSELELLANNRI